MAQILLVAGAGALTASGGAITTGLIGAGLTAGQAALAGSAIVGLAGVAGSLIDQQLFGQSQNTRGPQLASLSVPTSAEGGGVLDVFGTVRLPGEKVWALSKRQIENQQSVGKGFGGGGGTQTTYSYLGSFADLLCRGPVDRFTRVWGNAELFDPGEFDYRFYPGSKIQTADPLIAAAEEQAPAYRGCAYMVWQEMPLDRWGQSLPATFYEVTRSNLRPGLRGVVEAIARSKGIAHLVDASGVSDDPDVTGYAIDSVPMSFRGAIEPLAMLFRLDIADVDGGLVIRSRDETPVAEIVEQDMEAREDGAAMILRRASALDVPRKVGLKFTDADRDFAPAQVSHRRSLGVSARETVMEFPGVLSTADATKRLIEAHQEMEEGRTTLDFGLGLSQLALAPGDFVGAISDGRRYSAQIARAVVGDSIRIEARAASSKPGLVRSTVQAPSLRPIDPTPTAPEIYFLDMAMLTDGESDPHQPWLAADAATWRGITAYRDAGQGFKPLVTLDRFSQIGTLQGALPAVADASVLDETNTLSVTMRRPYSFEGAAVADLESSPINAVAVRHASGEWEALQFSTAALVGDRAWNLTGLRRGRRGTEHAMGAVSGAPLVVLTESMVKVPVLPEEIGTAFPFRSGPSPLPNDNALFTEETLTFAGKGLRPYTPVDLDASEPDQVSDITITATPRPRISTDPSTKPADHTVRVYDGATVLQTFTSSADPISITYARADANADNGGTPPATLDLGVTPRTAAFGDGVETRLTVTL